MRAVDQPMMSNDFAVKEGKIGIMVDRLTAGTLEAIDVTGLAVTSDQITAAKSAGRIAAARHSAELTAVIGASVPKKVIGIITEHAFGLDCTGFVKKTGTEERAREQAVALRGAAYVDAATAAGIGPDAAETTDTGDADTAMGEGAEPDDDSETVVVWGSTTDTFAHGDCEVEPDYTASGDDQDGDAASNGDPNADAGGQ